MSLKTVVAQVGVCMLARRGMSNIALIFPSLCIATEVP